MRKSIGLCLSFFIFLQLLFLSHPTVSYACSCESPRTVTDSLQRATAVFSGKVLDVDLNGNTKTVQFQVDTAWKGVDLKKIVVRTPAQGPSCGYEFREGESYLVYAYDHNKTGKLETNLCNRNQELKSATEDLAALGPGKKPTTEPAPAPIPANEQKKTTVEQTASSDGMGLLNSAYVACLMLGTLLAGAIVFLRMRKKKR